LTTAVSNSCNPAGIATPAGFADVKYCLKLIWVLEDKGISPVFLPKWFIGLYFALLF
jgi:hypothetical protein